MSADPLSVRINSSSPQIPPRRYCRELGFEEIEIIADRSENRSRLSSLLQR